MATIANAKTIKARIDGLTNLLNITPLMGVMKNNKNANIRLKFGNGAYTNGKDITLPIALMVQEEYDRSEVISLLAHELGHQFFTPQLHDSGAKSRLDSRLGDYAALPTTHDFENVAEDLRVDNLGNQIFSNNKMLAEYSLLKTINDPEYFQAIENADNANLTGLAYIFEGYKAVYQNQRITDYTQKVRAALFNRAKQIISARKMSSFKQDYEMLVHEIEHMIDDLNRYIQFGNTYMYYSENITVLVIKSMCKFYETYFVKEVQPQTSPLGDAGNNQDSDSEKDQEGTSGKGNDSDNQDHDSSDDNSDDSSDEDKSDNTNADNQNLSAPQKGTKDKASDDKGTDKSSDKGDSDGDNGDSSDNSSDEDGADDSSMKSGNGSSSDETLDQSSDADSDAGNGNNSGHGQVKATSDVHRQKLDRLSELSDEILNRMDPAALNKTQKELIEKLKEGIIYNGETAFKKDDNSTDTVSYTYRRASIKEEPLSVNEKQILQKLYNDATNLITTKKTAHPHPLCYWDTLEKRAFSENMNILGKLKQVLKAYTPRYYTSPSKSGFRLNKSEMHNIASGQYVKKPFSVKEKGIDLSTDIVLLTDVSGSMENNAPKSGYSKETLVNETMLVLCDALGKVGQKIRVAIAAYDNDVYSVKGFDEPFSKLKTQMPVVEHGSTNGENAMLWAIKSLRYSKAHRKFIICLTDGMWDRVKPKDQYDLIRKAGIETYGIGYMREENLNDLVRNDKLPFFDRWFVVGSDIKEFYIKFLSDLLKVAPH